MEMWPEVRNSNEHKQKKKHICMSPVVLIGIAVFCFGCNEKYTDVAVLSTTDMHGKGWDINLLTDQPEKNSMLSVATAAAKTREEFGEDNVILIDNGDLYQGTPFSQLSLTEYTGKEGSSVPSMSVCLEKAGYDAFIPGNHEFDYSWDIMSNVYKDLEENGIPVVTCNVCYDGSDGTHEQLPSQRAPSGFCPSLEGARRVGVPLPSGRLEF